jgi:hypothetical protein
VRIGAVDIAHDDKGSLQWLAVYLGN